VIDDHGSTTNAFPPGWDLPFAKPDPDPSHHWGTCRREDHPRPPMFTEDGSGYFSALRTLADFSCVAYESLPPKES
jgi:hypothetical protein